MKDKKDIVISEKKNLTRNKILKSAMEHFLKEGFKSAPLRKIVSDAGVTTGAFYGYFSGKEDLFYALTDEAASGFMEILDKVRKEMYALPKGKFLEKMCGVYIEHIPEIVDYILEHKCELRLILNCGGGTKYEDFLDKIRMRNEDNIEKGASYKKLKSYSPGTLDVLMRGYFYMLTYLVMNEDDRDKIIKSMTEIALVYRQGILSRLGKSK